MKDPSTSRQHPVPSPAMFLNLTLFHPLQERSRLYLSLYLLSRHSSLPYILGCVSLSLVFKLFYICVPRRS